jgi:hypothetical protein
MSLSTTSELLVNDPFMGRVAAAVLLAAGDIREQTSNLPANHASRVAWAESIDNYSDARQIAGWYAPLFVASDQDLIWAYEHDEAGFGIGDQRSIGDASIINGVNAQIDDDADTRFPQQL